MDILKSRSEARRTEISLLLYTEQVFKLDEIAAVIRHDTGKQLTRSVIIAESSAASLPYKQNWLKCTRLRTSAAPTLNCR